MARRPTGSEVLERARRDIAHAKTVEQLRTAQAVVLPLDPGLSLAETAKVVGRSAAWVARERRRYINGDTLFSFRLPRGGRRNQLMSEEDEIAIVKRGITLAAYRLWTPPRNVIRELIEEKVGDVISDSTLNAILARVARKTIPGGRARDLTQLDRTLTEKWMRERVLVQKKMGKKFAV